MAEEKKKEEKKKKEKKEEKEEETSTDLVFGKKTKLGETIRKKINTNRVISISFPVDIYFEFKKYAKEKTGDCYWLAIKELLNQSKYYSFLSETVQVLINNNNMLVGKLLELEDRMNELTSTLSTIKTNKKEFKHFGRKEEEKKNVKE